MHLHDALYNACTFRHTHNNYSCTLVLYKYVFNCNNNTDWLYIYVYHEFVCSHCYYGGVCLVALGVGEVVCPIVLYMMCHTPLHSRRSTICMAFNGSRVVTNVQKAFFLFASSQAA